MYHYHFNNYPLNNTVTYILMLEDNCWYVGITKNGKVNSRLKNHFDYGGAAWTRIHKPIKVHRVLMGNREEEVTRKLIERHGEDYVRGHNFVQVKNPSFKGIDASNSSISGCITIEPPVVNVSTLF